MWSLLGLVPSRTAIHAVNSRCSTPFFTPFFTSVVREEQREENREENREKGREQAWRSTQRILHNVSTLSCQCSAEAGWLAP